MIDQAAAVPHYRRAYEKWRLKLGGRTIGVPTLADRREVLDPMPYNRLLSDVFDDSVIDLDRRNEFINSTTLLGYRNILDTSVCDDYVMLLPFRVYGYAMLNRKWFPLNLSLISDITPEQVKNTAAGYEDLVLPDGHKKLLQAVVKNQVAEPRQRPGEREEDPDEFQMDVVQGKGKGLIILLHGAPGVGKTSTAECVAAQLKRPLLPITCGDVSTNAKDAEETLQQYCALAHRWRCVLLLDEADVFLAKREKGDVKRNGLVSGKLPRSIKSRGIHLLKNPSVPTSPRILLWGHHPNHKPRRRVRRSVPVPNPHQPLLPQAKRRRHLTNLGAQPTAPPKIRPRNRFLGRRDPQIRKGPLDEQ